MTGPVADLDPDAVCAGPAEACRAEFGWGLMTLARSFRALADDAVRDLPGGLRGHLVLTSIAQGQPPSQAALAGQIGLDRTVMTYLIDELEQAGYLERRPDPADRRARLLVITAAGTTALGEYRRRIDAAEQRLLDPLSAAEAAAFRGAIERVARASRTPARVGPTTC